MIGYILKCTMSPYQNAACSTLPAIDGQTVRKPCQSTEKIVLGDTLCSYPWD
jgi:hypothetical protein